MRLLHACMTIELLLERDTTDAVRNYFKLQATCRVARELTRPEDNQKETKHCKRGSGMTYADIRVHYSSRLGKVDRACSHVGVDGCGQNRLNLQKLAHVTYVYQLMGAATRVPWHGAYARHSKQAGGHLPFVLHHRFALSVGWGATIVQFKVSCGGTIAG